MRALTVTAFGHPGVLEVHEIETPTPQPGEITIDVSHAAVGLVDVFLRRGDYRDKIGLPQPPYIPGLEVAGTVRSIGSGVTGFREGERVATLTLPQMAGLAQVVSTPASLVVSLEGTTVSSEQAAACLGNAATAYLALTASAHLQPNEQLLVHGVTGGLASTFPAVAKMLGASKVVGTVRRPERVDDALALGVDEVVLANDFISLPQSERFDVIVDAVGGELRRHSLTSLAKEGRLLLVGNASGANAMSIDTTQIWQSTISVIGFSIGTVYSINPDRGVTAGKAVLPLIESGTLNIPVTVESLDNAPDAFARYENGSMDGRLLLMP